MSDQWNFDDKRENREAVSMNSQLEDRVWREWEEQVESRSYESTSDELKNGKKIGTLQVDACWALLQQGRGLLFKQTKGVSEGEGDGDSKRKVSASFLLLLEGFGISHWFLWICPSSPAPPTHSLLFFCPRCLVVLLLLLSLVLPGFLLRRMEGGEEKAVAPAEGRRFKRICVFCGSRSGNRPSFSNAALEVGKQLVDRKIDLVYGGGSVGLMGLVSQTVFAGGCHVLGYSTTLCSIVLPFYISGEGIGEVKEVADMHERKSEMAKHADAFIALPGGYGTMEELLEMITWSQLGIHEKPVGLLNVDGYYNSLLALFDKGVEEGFIEDSARDIVVTAETAEELFRKMEIEEGSEEERTSSICTKP
ncbi:hypothetical protein Taro_048810 [Colocasia esculenta]|uniref:cytokinin riboside 5'-monophosphate phosphoribohydrolase n=2 Tax=Magnoliopsida TaxID=3398 RepID=A0A843X944_COLES|nr:hypothetical protein [Colocasia esculenta]